MLSRMKQLVFDVGGLPNSRRSPSEKPVSSAFPLREVHAHTHTLYLTHILLLLLLSHHISYSYISKLVDLKFIH